MNTDMKIEWLEKHMVEAEKLIVANEVQEGLNILNGLLYEEPGYGSLHNHLGWAHLYFTGNLQMAERHLQVAIKFNAEFAAPYVHLGALYMKQNRFADAAAIFERGLQLDAADKFVMLDGLARAQESVQNYKAAIKSYREAALASLNDAEIKNLTESIRRCRKKKWMRMIS
jgi:tetratricopeptide (TPR) repeat protein